MKLTCQKTKKVNQKYQFTPKKTPTKIIFCLLLFKSDDNFSKIDK